MNALRQSYRSSRGTASVDAGPVDDTTIDLPGAIDSFRRYLRASNRSDGTVGLYTTETAKLLAFLRDRGMPLTVGAVRREHLETYLAWLRDTGKKPATLSLTYRSLQQFWKWLLTEDEIASSPMAKMRPPIVPEDPIQPLRQDQLEALLKVCSGTTFDDRRDYVVIQLLYDTGLRRGECAGLVVEDVDFDINVVRVRGETSKSRRGRNAPIGPKTAKALDRYLRARAKHSAAAELVVNPRTHDPIGRNLWLGRLGRLTDNGILQMVRRRGREAGLEGLHPHLFRHSFADSMLRLGMQEGNLMRLGGWRSRGMLQRYGAGAADDRARLAYDTISKRDRFASERLNALHA